MIDVDAAARTVALDNGQSIGFDQSLLAIGATPRALPIPGADLARIHYLRSLASCHELRGALATAEKLVVIGAGWTGPEVDAYGPTDGQGSAMIEAAQVPLERVLGIEAGALFADLHRDSGSVPANRDPSKARRSPTAAVSLRDARRTEHLEGGRRAR